MTSHFRRMTSFLAEKDVFLAFSTKMNSLDPFKVVFRLNSCRNKLFPLMCWIFWKKFFVVWRHIFDMCRHFWHKKTSFWQFSTNMSSLHPFKIVFRLDCQRKYCSYCLNYWWNRIKARIPETCCFTRRFSLSIKRTSKNKSAYGWSEWEHCRRLECFRIQRW